MTTSLAIIGAGFGFFIFGLIIMNAPIIGPAGLVISIVGIAIVVIGLISLGKGR